MTRFPTRVANMLVAFGVLTQQAQAAGLRRLRNNAVRVPDLAPIRRSDKTVDRDAGFDKVEEELEEVFLEEVFRLDASMSYDMSMGETSHSTSGSGSGDSSSGGEGTTSGSGSGDSSSGGEGTEPVAGGGGEDKDDGSDVYKKCGMSKAARSSALLDILSTISSRSQLVDTSTSRYNARYWLDHEDGAMLCPTNSARILQRYTAALIYFQLGGDGWENCRAQGGPCYQEDSTTEVAIPFLDSSHECLWFGLCCENVPKRTSPAERDIVPVDEHNPLTKVDVSDNSLSGELFVELFGLTKLQELTLDGNKGITGSIPAAVGQLTDLVAIDIDDNALVGTLPKEIYSLTNLEAIDLNGNALVGTISNDIGNLRNLVVVQLDNNELTGPMPTDGIFKLESLAVWTALDNDLTGSTERVCDVLEERRTNNQFPGYLQFFWVDCLGNPPQVECSCCECKEPETPTSF